MCCLFLFFSLFYWTMTINFSSELNSILLFNLTWMDLEFSVSWHTLAPSMTRSVCPAAMRACVCRAVYAQRPSRSAPATHTELSFSGFWTGEHNRNIHNYRISLTVATLSINNNIQIPFHGGFSISKLFSNDVPDTSKHRLLMFLSLSLAWKWHKGETVLH